MKALSVSAASLCRCTDPSAGGTFRCGCTIPDASGFTNSVLGSGAARSIQLGLKLTF